MSTPPRYDYENALSACCHAELTTRTQRYHANARYLVCTRCDRPCEPRWPPEEEIDA